MAGRAPARTAAAPRAGHSGQVAAGAHQWDAGGRPRCGRPAALPRTPGSAAGRMRAAYLTWIVFVADVLFTPPYVTRTRSLYLPLADGAFHLRL